MSLVRFRPEAPCFRGFSSSGRAPPCQGGGSEFEPRNPLHTRTLKTLSVLIFSNLIRHHGQAVRQGPAKPLSPVRFWVVPPKRNTSFWEVFLFVFVSARTQHHFSLVENIIPHQRTQNEVALCANSVVLRTNDVGLRPTMLHFVQMYAIIQPRR